MVEVLLEKLKFKSSTILLYLEVYDVLNTEENRLTLYEAFGVTLYVSVALLLSYAVRESLLYTYDGFEVVTSVCKTANSLA